MGTGTGLGKLILLGEHAVVHGHPAIAAGISLRTRIELHPRSGATQVVSCPFQDDRLGQALAVALPADGLAVHIESNLPVGRGMGSSAALAVALVRARASLEGRELDFETLHREGFAIERVFHGNPSGLDHAVSALGGVVLYRRDRDPEPLSMKPLEVVVLDSGESGNTAELVAAVARQRPDIDPLLERLGAIAEDRAPRLDDTEGLADAMNEAHQLLGQLGVSTPKLDSLVSLARAHGATGAKLSGAGGGGVVLALTPGGGQQLLAEARQRGIQASTCSLPEG